MRLHYLLFLLLTLLLTGCDDFFKDAVWVHKTDVAVKNSTDYKCLIQALNDIPSVEIAKDTSMGNDIPLKIKLERPISRLGIYVRSVNTQLVRIEFVGGGTHEPDEARLQIEPVLNVIATKIQNDCS